MYRSLSTVKADLARAQFDLTGEGIVWAVLATGVDGSHPHFATFRNTELTKPLRHLDYTSFYGDFQKAQQKEFKRGRHDELNEEEFLLRDRYAVPVPVDVKGLGTAVAGIIAGQSTDSDGNLLRGVTDRAKVLSIKVLDDKGGGNEFNLLAALKVVQLLNQTGTRMLVHGIVLPLSFGRDVRNFACGRSPICAEVDRLVNSGVVVVTSVGNGSFVGGLSLGPLWVSSEQPNIVEGAITDPGNAELAIGVGSTHRSAPEIYGASFFSSRGPTADGGHILRRLPSYV
jgi:serine protease AprX